MAKNSITDYSKTAASNTDIQSVDIDEGCLPSGINNAIRELMADLAAMNDGTVTLTSPSFAAASLTGNLSFGDDDKAIFGAGSDLQIFHQSSNGNSIIQEQGGGILSIKTNGSEIALYDTVNTTNMARFITGGAVKLFHNGSLKFETTSTGVDITGAVVSDGLTVDGLIKFSGLAPTVDYDFNADSSVTSADGLAYTKMGSGIATAVDISSVDTISPSWSALSGSTYSDNKFRIMSARGNSTDALRIVSSLTAEGHGDTTIIGNVDVDGVDTRLVSGLGISGEDINLVSDSNINFRTAGSTRLDIASNGDISFYEDTGTTAKLTWDASGEDLRFADNSKAVFGAGSDLQIYHDGSNSYVQDAGTGNLYIQSDGTSIRLRASDGTQMLRAEPADGSVRLYYGGSQKFITTSTGVDITGTVTADGLTVDGGGTFRLNASSTTDFFTIQQGGVQTVLTSDSPDGAGNMLFRTTASGVDYNRLFINNNGDISFYEDTGTTAKLFWDASAERLGLGTTSPDMGIHLSSGGTNYLRVTNTSTGVGSDFGTSSTGTEIINRQAAPIRFQTNATERMRIDSSGSVGIGVTSNITGNLTLPNNGVIAFHDAAGNGRNSLQFLSGELRHGGAGGGLTSQTFYTNGQQRVRIDSAGLVGIGTSSPRDLLNLSSSTGSSIVLENSTTSLAQNAELGAIEFYTNDASNAGVGVAASIRSKVSGSTGGQAVLIFSTADSVTNDVERMRIDPSGRVGIGTTSPSSALEVAGQVISTNSFKLTANVSTPSGNSMFRPASNTLAFATNSTERMRIDSSGRVGIGVTSPIYVVDAKSTTNGDIIFRAQHQGSGSVAFHASYGSSSGTAYFGWWKYNNAVVGSITSTGSSTSYNTSSDYRLKENVVDLTGAIARVKSLQPKRFNFIADADTTVDGFLAHEAATVVPEAVTGEKDAVDEDGNPEYQGIDQAKLVPLLTAALQEAITKIEDLEARVATLEGN